MILFTKFYSMRTFAFTLLLALTACTGTSDPYGLQGTWAVNKERAAAPIVGLSDEDTARLIGENLSVSATTMKFQNRSCEYKHGERNEKNIKEFLEFYSLNSDTELPKSTLILEIDCSGDLAIDQVLMNQNKIWFIWYGVLLEANRR